MSASGLAKSYRRTISLFKRWLREPLIHFFVLGGCLFVLFGSLNEIGFERPNEIIIDGDRVSALQAQFTRTWRRSPTNEELSGLVNTWIREEIFYREGLALGLDQQDPVVRQRVSLKMRFMADSLVSDDFSAAELGAYFSDNPELYRIDGKYTFRQVYFDPRRHGDALAGVLSLARQSLDASLETTVGDSTLLPAVMASASSGEIGSLFGSMFAAGLEALPVGRWSGPVESTYGTHLVFIEKRVPARYPDLEEVRESVERDLLAQRTAQAEDALFELLREPYTVLFSDGADVDQGVGSASGSGSP